MKAWLEDWATKFCPQAMQVVTDHWIASGFLASPFLFGLATDPEIGAYFTRCSRAPCLLPSRLHRIPDPSHSSDNSRKAQSEPKKDRLKKPSRANAAGAGFEAGACRYVEVAYGGDEKDEKESMKKMKLGEDESKYNAPPRWARTRAVRGGSQGKFYFFYF